MRNVGDVDDGRLAPQHEACHVEASSPVSAADESFRKIFAASAAHLNFNWGPFLIRAGRMETQLGVTWHSIFLAAAWRT